MKRHRNILLLLPLFALLLWAAVGTSIGDFFLPGSQPGQSGNLEHPGKCDNCHGGYDLAVEPAFNWRGSMMAQAARDPLYHACLAIANQDAPESGDLCIRCHAPDGWLNGRSEPTDGSALNNNDMEGVQCDFCHKLVKPTSIGVNPYPGDNAYTSGTYPDDQDYLQQLTIIPPQSGNGMYIAHSANAKRGPFEDAEARHQMNYSPFHSDSDLCGTCHDVSSPVFIRQEDGTFAPEIDGAPASDFHTYNMNPIERTFSEWKMSDFADGGVPISALGVEVGGNLGPDGSVSTCQDCHMQDVSGYGCNKKGVPFRNNLPLHDMTGGNTFVPQLVAQLYPEDINEAALNAGIDRATHMLQNAATMNVQVSGTNVDVEVINQTGHKLPSGYPEGRRIWLNVTAYDASGTVIFSSGTYDSQTAELDKSGTKIYEIKLGMSDAVAAAAAANAPQGHTYLPGESFHFVLNDKVIKDNRIPPRGFTNAEFQAIQSPVVDYSYADGAHSDFTHYDVGSVPVHVNVKLLYQTVSKEYIEFLRDENTTNQAGQILYDLWAATGKSEPVVMEEFDYYDPDYEQPTLLMEVPSVSFTRIASKGKKTSVEATVQVVDQDGLGLPGVSVTGTFSGPSSGTRSGVTDAGGIVTLTSPNTREAAGDWCVDLTLALDGYDQSGTSGFCEGGGTKSAPIPNPVSEWGLELYPNPGHNQVTIRLKMDQAQEVTVNIYNTEGRVISHLVDRALPAGEHLLYWDCERESPGIYYIRYQSPERTETRMIFVE